jgi:hypothetical protein
MKIFLLDLWHDLREKRLWPVAAVLAVGLVAVPVVLSKSAAAPPAPAAEQQVRTAPDPEDLKALASVKLDESAEGRGSSLNTFDPSNPFSPPKSVTDKAKKGSEASSTVTSDQGGDTVSGGSGGDSGSAGGDTGSAGGDTPSTGGGDTPSTGGGDAPTTTTQYSYVVDLTFTANGRTRRIKSMERLEMLPSQDSPLLLYLGVTANAGNAVFLVDSTLQAAGEGRCKPKASECAFLYLGAGSEHEFTNDEGDSYTLRIDEIRKVQVDGGTAAASRSKRAGAAVGAPTQARRFELPLLADLVTVSTGGADDSSDQNDRR